MDWAQVREMAAAGISFGAHGVTHRILSTLPSPVAAREVAESRAAVAAGLAGPVSSFCYPNGGWNADVARAVDETGFRVAFSTDIGSVGPDADRFAIRRFNVHEDATGSWPMFLARLSGRLMAMRTSRLPRCRLAADRRRRRRDRPDGAAGGDGGVAPLAAICFFALVAILRSSTSGWRSVPTIAATRLPTLLAYGLFIWALASGGSRLIKEFERRQGPPHLPDFHVRRHPLGDRAIDRHAAGPVSPGLPRPVHHHGVAGHQPQARRHPVDRLRRRRGGAGGAEPLPAPVVAPRRRVQGRRTSSATATTSPGA